MIKYLKQNKILFLILILGLFLRVYKPLTFFYFDHDSDLAGWIMRDILFNHHLRLIGQETSSHGIFIGPYFYYLQIPFFLLTKMDPAGTLLLPIILGIFSVWSVYFVFTKMFSKNVGLIGSLIYATSSLVVFTDREVVPTMPVMLWTIWFLFSLNQILKGKKYGYIILGILIGLVWSLNLQLIILMPLVILAQIFSKKQINFKELIVGSIIAFLMNIPFIAFELRHGFQQTKALFASLTTSKDYISGTSMGFFAKLDRTMQLVYKNSTNIFALNTINLDTRIMFWFFVVLILCFVYKKIISKNLGVIFLIWLSIYILFFSKISLNVSEYYLNGMNIVYIILAAIGINELIKNKKRKHFGFLLIGIFLILNLYQFFTRPVNADGYIERKAIISAIKEDADLHNYPCVSLSFITTPGNDLGYRYFTWEENLKTKPVSNNIPVYSIVFPLSLVDGFDKSYGALGLIKPDYKKYNLKTIDTSCEGKDYNLTYPMFGFTN